MEEGCAYKTERETTRGPVFVRVQRGDVNLVKLETSEDRGDGKG